MQDSIWSAELERLKVLLNWHLPLSDEFLYSLLQDRKYAEMLLTLINSGSPKRRVPGNRRALQG